MTRSIAFIAGVSRGIERVCAVDSAQAGFDVAITARTVHPGEKREHCSTPRGSDPPSLPEIGSTAGFRRVAGFIAVEPGPSGRRCFNVQPGPIATERISTDMHEIPSIGEPADVAAKVVTALATDPSAGQLHGGTTEAPYFSHEDRPLEGRAGQCPHDHPISHDRSGTILAKLEAAKGALRATGAPSRQPTGALRD